MRLEATTQEWYKLFEITKKIKELKPWTFISSSFPIICRHPNMEHDMLLLILGSAGEEHGFSLTLGEDAYIDFDIISSEQSLQQSKFAMYHQHALTCYFDGVEESIPEENYILAKELEKINNEDYLWCYFISYMPQKYPFHLDHEEVIFLNEILPSLYEALLQLQEEATEIYPKCFVIEIDENQDINISKELFPQDIGFQNELTVDIAGYDLQHVLDDRTCILDVNYSNTFIKRKNDRPLHPMLLTYMDADSMFMLGMEIIEQEDFAHKAADFLIRSFLKDGVPSQLILRNQYLLPAISDMCNSLKLPLFRDDLNFMDEIIEEIQDFMNSMNHFDA